MNDGIVDGIMQRGLVLKVLGGALPETRKAIAKHDDAMREALARVEAYLECARGDLKQQERMYWDAQAQLEEVVRLLSKIAEWPNGGSQYGQENIKNAAKAFLARHAQTEQQDDGRTCRFCQKRFKSAAECGNHVDHFHSGQAEQQEAPKRGKPDWNSHSYDQIFQTSDGNWFGAHAGWDFKGHISDGWKGREVSLLRDDGGFLAYGEPNPDWESSLEQRPAQEAQGAQPGEFQREERYIVIKRKDLGAVPLEVRESLGVALFQLSKHLPKRECLVIESDWPEYEPTWAAIQARVTGQGAQAGDERAAFCDAVREAAKEFLDTVDEDGLMCDEFGEFVHPEPKQLLRICQLYRAALATQPEGTKS